MSRTSIRLVGGPTVLIEIGGLRLLTDPTFDPPGEHPVGRRVLRKLRGPDVRPEDLGRVDAVLLSHDQHPDNLDDSGRAMLGTVPRVFTTAEGARRLGGAAEELPWWQHRALARPDGGELRVIGVPAFHGPIGSEAITGPVMGFVLCGSGVPTMYVSGDNASLDVVAEIAHHLGPIEVAVLFAGAGRTPLIDAYLTLGSDAELVVRRSPVPVLLAKAAESST